MMVGMPTVLLALVVLSSPLHANLIQNGNFDTGDFTGWTRFTTTNGSLGVNPLPRITSFDVSGTGSTIAAEFQVGQITSDPTGTQAGGGIEQIVSTDAGLYRFSADIAALSLRVNADAGNMSVLVDGIAEDTVNFGSILTIPPFMPLLRETLTFSTSLSAGMHEIEILITRSLQNSNLTPDQFITNITLEPQVDPAPEPATWTIICVALAGLAIARRRLSQHQGRRHHLVAQRSG